MANKPPISERFITVNHSKGRTTSSGTTYIPIMIVNHIVQGSISSMRHTFANPTQKVSAHFGVGRKGELDQYVRIGDRAWHAGSIRNPRIEFPYSSNISPNWYSVGIEWEGWSGQPITEDQYQAGLALHRWLLTQIPDTLPLRQRVIGHFQINSIDRPNCPGPTFPWERLYADLESTGGNIVTNPTQTVTIPVEMEGEIKEFNGVFVNGTNYIAIRPLLESLGYKVGWDGQRQMVVLQKKETWVK